MEKETTTLYGKLYDIQGFSVHDGPGIRTTVFLKGCPLHCPWCHSPESQSFQPQMSYTAVRCIGTELCGECLKVCPAGAVAEAEEEFSPTDSTMRHRIKWSRAKCTQCGACTNICFPEALSFCGKDYTVEDVLAIVRKDFDFFRSSGGGVTVSGGEPLCQLDFTTALLEAAKSEGIHTAVDTTGFAPNASIRQILPWTDLFLYDLKQMDSVEHERITGVPNERILDNARWLVANGGRLQIRIPVIPGYNDSRENLDQAARFCAELRDGIEMVQLLPYHHFGASKYQRMQMHDPMLAELKPPTDETMESYRELMRSYGLKAAIH